MYRDELIAKLRDLNAIKDDKFTWASLCSLTKFDSFITALALGLKWDYEGILSNINDDMLNIAYFNITHFPRGNEK